MEDTLLVLLTAGAAAGAVSAVSAVLWWLVAPRIRQGIETACRSSVADVLADHDLRIIRLEDAVREWNHPRSLLEYADLIELVRSNSPTPPPPGREQAS